MFSDSITAVQDFLRNNQLEDFLPKHGIRAKTDGNHIILDYHMNEVNWDEPYGKVCRGLVLCAKTFEVLGFGLHKFWNAGEERAAELDWTTAKVFEKLDGSMVSRWWSPHLEKFCYSTRYQLPGDLENNIVADSGLNWIGLIEKSIGDLASTLDQLSHETVVFEVMSPANRVVVIHNGCKCGLLARRNNLTFEEHDLSEHPLAPKIYDLNSREDVESFAETLKGTESEGCVVVDSNFNRVKIKGSSYVGLHHLRDSAGSSMKSLIFVVRKNEESEISSYFPEFVPAMDAVGKVIREITQKHIELYNSVKHIEDQKEFALAIKDLHGKFNTGILFRVKSGKDDSVEDAIDKLDEKGYLRMFRPAVDALNISIFTVA